MLMVGILLFLLKATGMTSHIIISVAVFLVLVAYTVLTKKEWKIPALEIIMRVFYGIALITGVVIMNVHGIIALAIVHKASAVLFIVLLAILFILKLCTKKAEQIENSVLNYFWRNNYEIFTRCLSVT